MSFSPINNVLWQCQTTILQSTPFCSAYFAVNKVFVSRGGRVCALVLGANSQLAPRFRCWLIQKDLAPQRDYFWLLQLIPEVYFYLLLISMKLEARTVSSRGAVSECYSKKSTRRLHPALLIILFQVLLALIPFLYSNGYQTGYHLCSSPRSLRLGLWFCAAAGGTGIAWQMAAATIYSGGQAAPGERCSVYQDCFQLLGRRENNIRQGGKLI